jgi:gamma-glutamylcyclotransferase
MAPLKYFAYGSNLHPVRLQQRVPQSEFLCVATLAGYRLCFHKRAGDGSGKCNIFYTGDGDDLVHGAIYQLPIHQRYILDRYEGVGYGYEIEHMEVSTADRVHKVFAYVAQESHIDNDLLPYHWYKELVARGARHHRMPQHYISRIDAVASIPDQEHSRRQENESLLETIRNYPVID